MTTTLERPDLQTQLAERLLLEALHEHDAAREAEAYGERSAWLARLSGQLAMSLGERNTCDTIRNVALPRPGSWCIADVIQTDGSFRRLPINHPVVAKQALARELEQLGSPPGTASPLQSSGLSQPTLLSPMSGAALLDAVHGGASLRILNQIGFSYLLVVPMIVRAKVHGTLIFVAPPGTPAFTADEMRLALDLAARCGMALENARLYHQAELLRDAAEQANETKSQFLRSMSHELRTPLNAIGGFAQLIDMEIQGPVTAAQHEALGRIIANQEHLLAMITEILTFARIESGRMTYDKCDVSVSNALASVASMLALAATGAGMRIVLPQPDPTVVAWADPDRLRQILLNLVMNAIKYGGSDQGTIVLSCESSGESVTATVTDSGVGIDRQKLDSIFQPFVQLPAALTERREGVGLGLAISRDLARGMDGELTVESAPGKGARFILTLPRAQASHPLSPPVAP